MDCHLPHHAIEAGRTCRWWKGQKMWVWRKCKQHGNKVKQKINSKLYMTLFCVLLGEELWIHDKQRLSQRLICHNNTRVRCACTKLSTFHVAWRKTSIAKCANKTLGQQIPSTNVKASNIGFWHLKTGWWFQRFFIFTPIWVRFPIWLAHIFQMGGKKPPSRRFSPPTWTSFFWEMNINFLSAWVVRSLGVSSYSAPGCHCCLWPSSFVEQPLCSQAGSNSTCTVWRNDNEFF